MARAVRVSISSAIPAASLAMILAVAGDTTRISARWARATCWMANSEAGSNISVMTGWPVRLRKVRGVTNSWAELVITV